MQQLEFCFSFTFRFLHFQSISFLDPFSTSSIILLWKKSRQSFLKSLKWIENVGNCHRNMSCNLAKNITLSYCTLVLALIDQYTVKSLSSEKDSAQQPNSKGENTLTMLVFPSSFPESISMVDVIGSWQLNCHITHLCLLWLTSIRSILSSKQKSTQQRNSEGDNTLTMLVFPSSFPELISMVDVIESWQLNCQITHLCLLWLTSIQSNLSL